MIYGIDIAGNEIRWIRMSKGETKSECGRIKIGDNPTSFNIQQTIKELFNKHKIKKFALPIHGKDVRARFFTSDKVDISELEDHVPWEARFHLEYQREKDILSFDPIRSMGKETWIVAVAANRDLIRKRVELFPANPIFIDTALTSLANSILQSPWAQKDVMLLHLDRQRAFLVVVTHGSPILMQEIFNMQMQNPNHELTENEIAAWQEELKLRRNFLPQDNRHMDRFLLCGEAGLNIRNAIALGSQLDIEGEVFNPFSADEVICKDNEAVLYAPAYGSALRGIK